MNDDHANHIVLRLAKFMCDANAEIMRFTKNRGHIHNTGSEGYVSGYIASRIFSENLLIVNEYVDHVRLEKDVRGLVDEGSGEYRDTGRFDIVCYGEADNEILIVEVKRYFSPSALREDAGRIVAAIRKSRSAGGNIKGGVLLGAKTAWAENARKSSEEVLEDVEASIRDYESDIHTWGGYHEAVVVVDSQKLPQSVTGFAVLIKG